MIWIIVINIVGILFSFAGLLFNLAHKRIYWAVIMFMCLCLNSFLFAINMIKYRENKCIEYSTQRTVEITTKQLNTDTTSIDTTLIENKNGK